MTIFYLNQPVDRKRTTFKGWPYQKTAKKVSYTKKNKETSNTGFPTGIESKI